MTVVEAKNYGLIEGILEEIKMVEEILKNNAKAEKIEKKNDIRSYDGWSFSIVNGRLGEIHFVKGFGIWAHCYVKRSEFSKSEQK